MNVAQSRLRLLWQWRLHGARAALLCMAGFAFGWALVEDVFAAHLRGSYDLMQIVWMRYAVHLLVVFALWGWLNPSRIWKTERRVLHLLRSLMMLVMPLSSAWAITGGVPPQLAWAIFWCSPLLVVFLAIIWRYERPSPVTWVGIALGTLGMLAIVAPALPSHPVVPFAPIIMALSFSAYVIMTRFLRHEHVEANLFYTAFGVFLVLSFFMPRVWVMPSIHDVEMIVGIGVFGFVSLLLLDRAVSHAALSVTTPAMYLQVAFASMIGMVSSSHRPGLHVMAGIALIVGAGAVAWALPEAHELTRNR